jgi:hypothetical protein
MKLKFKTQAYQTAAVQAVVDCFEGQIPHHGGIRYRLDPGVQQTPPASKQRALALDKSEAAAEREAAFRNADISLSESALLDNLQKVQRTQNLPVSDKLVKTKVSGLNMVERFFRDITTERLRRGVFTSVPELISAINEYIAHHNTQPKPFIWTKSARDILQKVIRANSRLSSKQNGTPH